MNRHTEHLDDNKSMSLVTVIGLVVIAAVITFSLLYFWLSSKDDKNKTVAIPIAVPEQTQPVEIAPPVEPAAPVVEAEVTLTTPVQVAEPVAPLPNLYNSDEAVMGEINTLDAEQTLVKLILPESLIQRFVRVVIALHEGGKVVHDYRPITSPTTEMIATPIDEQLDPDIGQRYRLAIKNYNRYDPWVNAFESVDKKKVAKLYRRYYPLLQEAYQQHGAKIKEFDTVFMQVLDNTLKISPMEEQPILIRQKVLYQYYDKSIEKKSDLEKLFIRVGPMNASRLQNALRELREEINASKTSR